ncbi:GP139 protein, partial [Amia calva]|nr:GP139 protein [Amia calva]
MLSRSSTYYLMAISVADTMVLVLIVVLEITLKYNVDEPYWSRDPWCSLRDIFNYGAYNASTWLVVVFTMERFIAINTLKLKAKLCTPKSAMIIIAVVFVCSHLFAIPYFWSNKSSFNESNHHLLWACVYNQDLRSLYVHSLVWFQTVLVYILPFIIIFSLNGLTLRQIVRSNKVHSETSGPQRCGLHFRSKKRKSMLLLISVSMTFALLSFTRFITQLVLRLGFYDINRNNYSLPINVAADIGTMLDLSNTAINMYLYACTQTKFRKEVVTCIKLAISPCMTCKPPRYDYPSVIFQL